MKHLAGGKVTSGHTSAIDTVQTLVKFLVRLEGVSKVDLGEIKQKSGGGGLFVVKIRREGGRLLLKVGQNRTVQEVSVYCHNQEVVQETMEKIAREVRNMDWKLKFT